MFINRIIPNIIKKMFKKSYFEKKIKQIEKNLLNIILIKMICCSRIELMFFFISELDGY